MSLGFRLLLVAVAVAMVTADGYYEEEAEEYQPTTTTYTTTTTETPKNKCYQCSYSPGKTIYKEKEFVKKIHDPKTGIYKIVREKKLVPERQVGGWDKCAGSFTAYQSVEYGIDTWECDYNCFVRIDKAGNLFRGCYRGEFGVDPNNVGDIQQVGDSQYKFCGDDRCNNYDLEHV